MKLRKPSVPYNILAILIRTYADIRVAASDEKEVPIVEVVNTFSWNELHRRVSSNK